MDRFSLPGKIIDVGIGNRNIIDVCNDYAIRASDTGWGLTGPVSGSDLLERIGYGFDPLEKKLNPIYKYMISDSPYIFFL